MSAECHRCGTDLVYRDWPVGECPVCEPEITDEMIERAAVRVVRRWPVGHLRSVPR